MPGRRGYLRGRLLREQATGDYLVQPLGTSGTHLLSSLGEANGLIVLPEDLTEATVDEQVTVAFLPAPSEARAMAHAYPGRSSGRHPGWPARLGPLRVPRRCGRAAPGAAARRRGVVGDPDP